jgi:protein-S-isoprenylcysteine O-methyltransferase Ste14
MKRFPGVDLFSHDAGHIWYDLLGFKGDPHANPIHILSNVLIIAGFFLLAGAWRVLFKAQQDGTLATAGPYRRIRHPQYVAFIVIMLGFLVQWPTLVTLVMFPIMVTIYVRLAHREEREVAAQFGQTWKQYAAVTPGWFPRIGGPPASRETSGGEAGG